VKNAKSAIQKIHKCFTVNNVKNASYMTALYHIVQNVKSVITKSKINIVINVKIVIIRIQIHVIRI